MTKEWFYGENGQNRGPFSPEQMQAFVTSRTIDGTTLVWSSPMPAWLPLSQTELASRPSAAPGPAPAPARPNVGGQTNPGGQAAPTHITVGGKMIAIPEFIRTSASPDFLVAVQTCLAKYADFEGRAARPEYWWFYLFNVIVIVAAAIVDAIISVAISLSIFQLIASLALLVPMLAAGSRRLHDIGKSGWLQLLSLTIIGIIPLIYWLCQPGEAGQNKYGPPTG